MSPSQGNIIGIDTVLTPPSAAVACNPPLWDPSPAATTAARYTTLVVQLSSPHALLHENFVNKRHVAQQLLIGMLPGSSKQG
jgi:hypothetical protein